jgi:O-antigen/teichoic acid export membrane protein
MIENEGDRGLRRLRPAMRRGAVARTSAGLTASRVVSGLLYTLASIIVARAAGASALGVFGLALTIGTYATLCADAGVSQFLLPELGRTDRRAWNVLWADAQRFAVRSLVPLVVAYALPVAILTHGDERLALLAVALWWVPLRLSGYARPFFIAAERAGIEAVAAIIESGSALIAIYALLQVSASPALAALGLGFGAVLGLAARLEGLRRLGVLGGRPERCGRILALAAAPFAAVIILNALYLRIDIVLLSIERSSRELGLYQPPVRLVTALLILPDALAAVLLVRSSRAPDHQEIKQRQEHLLAFSLPVGLVLVAVCALAGKPLLGLTFGSEFRQSSTALALLIATVPLALLSAMNGNSLVARGLVWQRVACLGVASVCAIGLGIPAIARFGYVGAAGVSVVNELVLVLAYGLALGRLCGPGSLVLPKWSFRAPVSAAR